MATARAHSEIHSASQAREVVALRATSEVSTAEQPMTSMALPETALKRCARSMVLLITAT